MDGRWILISPRGGTSRSHGWGRAGHSFSHTASSLGPWLAKSEDVSFGALHNNDRSGSCGEEETEYFPYFADDTVAAAQPTGGTSTFSRAAAAFLGLGAGKGGIAMLVCHMRHAPLLGPTCVRSVRLLGSASPCISGPLPCV